MQIILKKKLDKNSILKIIRDDGTSTWSKLHFGMETHDLCHYAVESTLGFKNAFFGIINNGYDIGDFELPKHLRPNDLQPKNLHNEALVTEHMVNLLEVEYLNSGLNSDFMNQLNSILNENNLTFPQKLNSVILSEIREYYNQLVLKWRDLPENESLYLKLTL